MNPQEIDKALSSNFNEDVEVFSKFQEEDSIEVFESYDGSNDVYLEMKGPKNLMTKELGKSTQRETFRIFNDSPDQKIIAISPACYPTTRASVVTGAPGAEKYKANGGGSVDIPAGSGFVATDILVDYANIAEINAAGHNVDCVADDGIVFADAIAPTEQVVVTASKPESRLRNFLNYLKTNPSHFVKMHLSSDDPAFYETEMILKRVSPYSVYGERIIPLQDFFTPNNQLTDKIIVEEDFQLDGQTLALLTIPAGATVVITLVAGVVESAATGLRNKIEKVKNEAGTVKTLTALESRISSAKPRVSKPAITRTK